VLHVDREVPSGSRENAAPSPEATIELTDVDFARPKPPPPPPRARPVDETLSMRDEEIAYELDDPAAPEADPKK
jgi:hypothetical protein